MKRVLAAFLVGTMAIAGFSVNTAAYSNQSGIITVQDVNGGAKGAVLTVTSTNVTCTSFMSQSGGSIKSIKGTQTLEKRNSSNSYSAVSGKTWTETTNSTYLCISESVSGLSAGTYRLKTVFTVTLSNGKTETTTVYSVARTVK